MYAKIVLTVNTDAIKDATLYKGNIPAMYGGRSSSVLDFVYIFSDSFITVKFDTVAKLSKPA
ncbi:hypothetical protein FXV77_19060 [Sphingobacterium phlebotomi]|uniref:Uncharacterized protein n=1 Tax=Sphingobacterium phlebotomi TaxID=2605433 RepID=A0A5D4GX21_9SPHI|nr:hypothetical protein [Sphingobacterium phlebotomi]TYR32533.1 hypothetical protein FXV77_19060 [Sphingobacterium phlebotomi]